MKIVIDAHREGYAFDQVRETLTAGELIDVLSEYDPDTPVYLGHDRQSYGWYTFGGITYDRILSDEFVEDESDELS